MRVIRPEGGTPFVFGGTGAFGNGPNIGVGCARLNAVVGFVANNGSNLTTLAAWTSSDNTVATTSQNGNYQCLKNGTITVTASVTNPNVSGTTTLTCQSPTFVPQGPFIVTQGSSNITVAQFTGSSASPPYTFSSPDLGTNAPWLALSNSGCGANQINCVLSGTPSTVATYNFHIQVTDSLSHTGCSGSGCPITVTVTAAAAAAPQLPNIWVDSNRAFDGVNCTNNGHNYCSGTGFTAPAYELKLTATGGVWVGTPPTCSPFTLANYTNTGDGLQSAITDVEACRTYGLLHGPVKDCTVIDVPPLPSSGTLYSPSNGTGIVIPQTSATAANCFNVIRSTQEAALIALGEPVCFGGMQDNVPTATSPMVRNPTCDGLGTGLVDDIAAGLCPSGTVIDWQLGQSFGCTPAGAFTLANGRATNTSNYNYVQYMPQIACTGSACVPFTLCSAILGKCTSNTIGVDHWQIADLGASKAVGATDDRPVFTCGDGPASATSIAQYASFIDWRRDWGHGDWISLAAGRNSIENGFFISTCNNSSLEGVALTMALRPGAEGHSVGAGQVTGGTKVVNSVFEGQSSGMFVGGQANATGPQMSPIGSFVPGTDMQIGRVRFTFPYSWLGVGDIPSTNTFWGGTLHSAGYNPPTAAAGTNWISPANIEAQDGI